MLKLLKILLLSTIALSAKTEIDQKQLVRYFGDHVVKNPDVKVTSVTILEQKSVDEVKGWEVFFAQMKVDYNGEEIVVPEMFFYKDGVVAPSLVDIKTRKNYRDELKPSVPSNLYNKSHLIAGEMDAKHKIILFSDPLCPFCQEIFPDMLKVAIDNPKTIALYYYHLPLKRLHPASEVLTRIMHVAQNEGKIDVLEKIYAMKIDPKETNPTTILKAVEEQTGFSTTLEKIESKEVLDALAHDEEVALRMMVTGTPTVYIDGKWDKLREGFRSLVPKR